MRVAQKELRKNKYMHMFSSKSQLCVESKNYVYMNMFNMKTGSQIFSLPKIFLGGGPLKSICF